MPSNRSDVAEIFWSIAPILALAILVIALIMVTTESVDKIVWGR